MKIAEASVQMASQRVAVSQHEEREHLRAWKDGVGELSMTRERRGASLQAQAERLAQGPVGEGRLGLGRLVSAPADSRPEPARSGPRPGRGDYVVQLSDRAQKACPTRHCAEEPPKAGPQESLKISIVRMMVKAITGREMQLFDASELQRGAADAARSAADLSETPPPSDAVPAGDESVGWGLVYEYSEYHHESEQTSFSATGVVKTADGREIAFNAELNMSRSFTSRTQVNLQAGDALKDPLVVNFNGAAAELTQQQFSFDIDADGAEDQIHFVGPNSGFLALDRNDDGTINDGGELFGARTGDGFAELAAYDEDGNNWIDENDSIYESLRIWSKDADGHDRLMALGQRGVGAIYLGNVATQFDLKDADNALQGRIQSSGVYLHENGAVDSIQQVDLVV